MDTSTVPRSLVDHLKVVLEPGAVNRLVRLLRRRRLDYGQQRGSVVLIKLLWNAKTFIIPICPRRGTPLLTFKNTNPSTVSLSLFGHQDVHAAVCFHWNESSFLPSTQPIFKCPSFALSRLNR